jgi:hypothetical protein
MLLLRGEDLENGQRGPKIAHVEMSRQAARRHTSLTLRSSRWCRTQAAQSWAIDLFSCSGWLCRCCGEEEDEEEEDEAGKK